MFFSKNLWKTTDNVNKIIPVSAALSFEKLESALISADEIYLKPLLGSELVAQAEAIYEKDEPTDTELVFLSLMKTAELKVLPISVLKPAEYNPRKKLKPGDKEYEKIKASIEEFGFADPLVVNSDMTIIGGHQRLNLAVIVAAVGEHDDDAALGLRLLQVVDSYRQAHAYGGHIDDNA